MERLNPHRRLVRYLEGSAVPYEPVAPRGLCSAVATTVLVGTLRGAWIGFVIGGAVGVWIFLVGAVVGAPIGAVVGAVIGLPASLVLALVLARAPIDGGGPDEIRRATATTLAVLLELLVVSVFLWALLSDTGEDLFLRMLVVVPALAVYGLLAASLLRRAARQLADRWGTRMGWRPVREAKAASGWRGRPWT